MSNKFSTCLLLVIMLFFAACDSAQERRDHVTEYLSNLPFNLEDREYAVIIDDFHCEDCRFYTYMALTHNNYDPRVALIIVGNKEEIETRDVNFLRPVRGKENVNIHIDDSRKWPRYKRWAKFNREDVVFVKLVDGKVVKGKVMNSANYSNKLGYDRSLFDDIK